MVSDQCPTPRKLLNNQNLRWDWAGTNARSDDIPKFLRKLKQENCPQDCCAYCGVKLTEFELWWAATVLDHVVPQCLCRFENDDQRATADPEWLQFEKWIWDFANAVLACSGCNGAANRDRPDNLALPPRTLEEFFELRDKFFTFKWHRVQVKRAQGREALGRLLAELAPVEILDEEIPKLV
jgi:5-methylcytosine-specific restriction endonuclease McrA